MDTKDFKLVQKGLFHSYRLNFIIYEVLIVNLNILKRTFETAMNIAPYICLIIYSDKYENIIEKGSQEKRRDTNYVTLFLLNTRFIAIK